ncbi:MAG: NADH:flavin oxidoreductase [Thermovirgaceae bacterium]
MKKLFDNVDIGSMTLKNRFVRSATWERKADEKGYLTKELSKVYEELARGGIGMIITGYAFVHPEEQPNPGMMGICDDSFIDGYRQFTGMVHESGGRIVMQIAYGGTRTGFCPEKRVIWGPSAVPEYSTGVVAKEMTAENIHDLVKVFGDAADRVKKSGFDGVQLHGAHGYLLGQFLSPLHNQRKDKYGGTRENRARIILEVFEEVRGRVGPSFPVLIKINSEDCVPGGATFEDCRYVCRALSGAGIDAIEISGGIGAAGTPYSSHRPVSSEKDEAYFSEAAAAVAAEVDTPIILVGGLRSPAVMQRLLEITEIACFALSRPFLAEPHLVKRWESGDLTKARCLSCNRCRTDEGNYCTVFNGLGMK